MGISVKLDLTEEQAMLVLSALNAKASMLDDCSDTEQSRRRAEIRSVVLPEYAEVLDAQNARELRETQAMWSFVMNSLDAARLKDAQERGDSELVEQLVCRG